MDIVRGLFVCAGLMASSGVAAADRGFYFGLFGGQADYDFKEPPFVPLAGASPIPAFDLDHLPSAGSIPDPAFGGVFINPVFSRPIRSFVSPLAWPQSAENEATAWGALVGFRIFRYLAAEVSYLDLGTLERTERFDLFFPPGAFIETQHKLQTSGPAASVLGILPLGEYVELFARAGMFFADMELDSKPIGGTVQVIDGSDSITFGSDSLLWGAGAQFNWGEHWSVRLDFQRFDSVGEDNGAGEADIDLLSLGVLFRL